jgi:bilin biosynthesis protein
LRDAVLWDRDRLVNILGQIGDVRAVEPLIDTLRDENLAIRFGATNALGQIGETSVALLIDALRHSDSRVRKHGAFALRRIGTIEALAAVKEWLREQRTDE